MKVYSSYLLIIDFKLLTSETESFPKTITKRCIDCVYSRIPTINDQNTCAESDDNNLHYDVCGGDSGGILINLFYFETLVFSSC